MISAPGIGSGLDINSLVSQLVAAEGDAKTALLAVRRTDVEAEISAFGSLKSALASLQATTATLKSGATFEVRSASSTDETIFTASAETNAVPGTFDIVVSALAEAHKVASQGYVNSSATIGKGTLTISVGNIPFNIVITDQDSSVIGIRDAINDAANNTGVSATLINVDDGSGGTTTKLVLTSNKTGTANALRVTVSDDDGNDTDNSGLSALVFDPLPTGSGVTNMTELNAAVDASISIDGETVTSSTNSIVDAIQGVTINLLDKQPGVTEQLTVAADTGSVATKISDFVSAYNSFTSLASSLSVFDEQTGARGVLLGDSSLLSLNGQLRRELNSSVAGSGSNPLTNLVELGITTDKNGLLVLDDAKLDAALATDLDGVQRLFSSATGIATRLDPLLFDYVKSGGVFDARTSGLNNTLENIDSDLEVLDRRLTALEERLLAQFSALDQLLSELQSTSAFLDRQLNALSSSGNN